MPAPSARAGVAARAARAGVPAPAPAARYFVVCGSRLFPKSLTSLQSLLSLTSLLSLVAMFSLPPPLGAAVASSSADRDDGEARAAAAGAGSSTGDGTAAVGASSSAMEGVVEDDGRAIDAKRLRELERRDERMRYQEAGLQLPNYLMPKWENTFGDDEEPRVEDVPGSGLKPAVQNDLLIVEDHFRRLRELMLRLVDKYGSGPGDDAISDHLRCAHEDLQTKLVMAGTRPRGGPVPGGDVPEFFDVPVRGASSGARAVPRADREVPDVSDVISLSSENSQFYPDDRGEGHPSTIGEDYCP